MGIHWKYKTVVCFQTKYGEGHGKYNANARSTSCVLCNNIYVCPNVYESRAVYISPPSSLKIIRCPNFGKITRVYLKIKKIILQSTRTCNERLKCRKLLEDIFWRKTSFYILHLLKTLRTLYVFDYGTRLPICNFTRNNPMRYRSI